MHRLMVWLSRIGQEWLNSKFAQITKMSLTAAG